VTQKTKSPSPAKRQNRPGGKKQFLKKASHVLSGIDAGECNTTFTFGQDGKPFYMQGPHDRWRSDKLIHLCSAKLIHRL